MIGSMRSIAYVFACTLLLLTGCKSVHPVEYPPLHFTQYQPIYMTVSSIELVEDYKSSMRPPNVEHLIPYSPAEAMRIWTRDRLRTAASSKKTMQVIIRNGSVTASNGSSRAISWIPWVGGGGNTRYDAKLEVELRIYGEGVISEASVFINATRNATFSDKLSAADRNLAFRKLIADMMEEFNAETEKNMFMYFGNYISYSQSP